MASPANPSPFQGERLQIHELQDLSSLINNLESDSLLAKQIISIEVNERKVDQSELDAGGDPPKIDPETYEKFGKDLSTIILEIQKQGGVKSFKWAVVDQKYIRPLVFWESLLKTGATLKHLNLDFSVHELAKLSKLALPSPEFPVLETLSIDVAATHGDDGMLVETILRNSPAIRHLTLSLPNCDLEGCRIQGITWQYTLPSLQTLDLKTYNSEDTALSAFLLRHPKITTLDWNVDSDDGFVFPKDSLPELRAISMNFHGNVDLITTNLEILAQSQHLAHVWITGGCPDASYLQFSKLRKTLKCLKLDLRVYSYRERTEEPDSDDERRAAALEVETGSRNVPGIIESLLRQLPELQELAVDLETGNTYFHNDAGEFVNPDPMSVEDLIRALRMSDERGLQLPDEVLENFPEAPASLEYLKWDIGERREKGVLYRLERSEGRVRAVEYELLRLVKGDGWIEERVLEL